MKLRIKGDSLRLRVSRSELGHFLAGGRVQETIHLGAAKEARLTYALEIALQTAPVQVRYEAQTVTLSLSERQARNWSNPTEIGVYTAIDIDPEISLEVIIEKDFACLDRGDEENEDTFDNPSAGATC
jgi:hypothetical protein